jgi:type I restriction enzyme S subunit
VRPAQRILSSLPKTFGAAARLVPDESLLRRFHERCEPTMLLKQILLRINPNLSRTRDLLLPKLTSGVLDVPELDIETP